jgi:hypothetical protein
MEGNLEQRLHQEEEAKLDNHTSQMIAVSRIFSNLKALLEDQSEVDSD